MKDATPLDIYRLLVRSVIKTNGIQRISNDSTSHAVVLTEELIRSANASVDIYCHRLSSDVWGTVAVKSAVESARQKIGMNFRVVVQEKSPADIDASAFCFMKDSIRSYSTECLRANFMIVDKKAFRVEPDYSERKGFAYVNNCDMSGLLVNAFDSIYQTAV